MQKSRKNLSIQGLLRIIRSSFNKIKMQQVKGNRKEPITLTDCLMAGTAVFSLKYPSLLQFNNDRNKELIKHNLKTLYGIRESPSDTYMRERLDEVDPKEIR